MDAEDNLANLRVASFSYYLKPSEESFVQKIGGQIDDPLPAILSQETSFSITPGRAKSPIFKPSHNFNFSQYPINSQDNILSNHHVAASSFSPHLLNDAQENFVFTIKSPVQDLNSSLFLPVRFSPAHVERFNSTNGEIGVFGADKYFNMRLDYGTRMKQQENRDEEVVVDVCGMKPNLKLGTSSISSEASSWNSQAALLRNPSDQNISQTRPRRAIIGRRIFPSFGCSGPCSDKGAIHVAENRRGDNEMIHGEKGSQSQPGLKRFDNHFAFPVLNSEAQNIIVKRQLNEEKSQDPRQSLEVFGSDRMKKGDIATNLARKLSMLSWDAIPKASNPPTTTVGSTTICDDMTSDASSDLFEIEDISGTGYPILTMEAGHDNMFGGCVSPPTQYAPSEASIEWSVVTASAAEFSSVISDYDGKNTGISGDNIIPTNTTFNRNSGTKYIPVLGKEVQQQKSRPGGLLGCKSQKTVSVVETVQKTRIERY